MNWTKQAPTEPGWYWYRHDIGATASIWLRSGGKFYSPLIDAAFLYLAGEWYGPLQEPGGDAIENCVEAK